jgi:glycosyltransferase involved in cell wall biosynthesis
MMIFSKPSTLNFTGLRKIQTELGLHYPDGFPSESLVITASLPSLNELDKAKLLEYIKASHRIIFWCYGDLVWNLAYWKSIEQELISKEVTWVVASTRWKLIAQRFIPDQNITLIPHPFPVIRPMRKREAIRKEYGWSQQDKVLVYAGRRSQQKNLPMLWRVWNELKSQKNQSYKLALAGDWCQYGMPQFPEMASSILPQKKIWEELQKLFPEDLMDFGELDSQHLAELMLAADGVISLSTFLEEDFGLSLREARFLGTPVIATNWGGHADLKDTGTFLVTVDQDAEINFPELSKQIYRGLNANRGVWDYRSQLIPTKFNLAEFKGFLKADELSHEEWPKLMSGLNH